MAETPLLVVKMGLDASVPWIERPPVLRDT